MPSPAPRPRAVLWWEDLPIGVQIAVTLPLMLVGMWALHRYVFNQTQARSLTYAGFYAILLTFLVVGGTRAERARRRATGSRRPPPA